MKPGKTQNSSPLISLILPVHDQADHLKIMIKQNTEALSKLEKTYEIILVPNACRDNSQQICGAIADENPNIVVVTMEDAGWGRSVQAGLKAAQGEIICYTNSARTAPQDLVLSLLCSLAFPDCVIKANRRIRESWRRRLGSLLYNLECRALFDLSQWDINGTPKVFPRKLEKLLHLTRQDDLIDLEFNLICRQEGYQILEVPIFSSRRYGGASTTGYASALKLYWGAYKISRNNKRIQP